MTGTSPLLSIIMPNYNYARFIAQSIGSVVAQDYAPIELIVVDDGSTDNSAEVIEATLAGIDSLVRVEFIRAPHNVGKLGAINLALPLLRGEYSIILDADDMLTPGYASRCIHMLKKAREEKPHIGFIYTDCNLISAEGKMLDRGKSTPFDPVLLDTFSYVPEPAVVLTRAMVEAGPYDELIRKGTKHHKWRRIVANGWHGTHLAEPLFSYRMHENNLSGIGKRVMAEVKKGQQGERILSGYWPAAAR